MLAFVSFAVWQFRLIREEDENRKTRKQLTEFYLERQKRAEEEALKGKKGKKEEEEVRKFTLV